MAMGLSRGGRFPRVDKKSYNELHDKTKDLMSEGNSLNETGDKLLSEKEALFNRLNTFVNNGGLSEVDNKATLEFLRDAINVINAKEESVVRKQDRVHEDIQTKINEINSAASEFDEQASSLDSLTVDSASTEVSEAKKASQKKKQEFEQMRDSCVEKLRLQMQRAEMQQRKFFTERLRGR